MRLYKKVLTILITVLLVAMAIIVPVLPVFAASFSISLSSYSGVPNTTIYVYGTGLTANGTNTYAAFLGTNQVVGITIIPSTGIIGAYFSVPILPRGSYNITVNATADTQNTPLPVFTITPQIFLDISSGHIGDHFVVSGNGFAGNTPITIYFDGVAQTASSAVYTDSLGQFVNATINVPASYGGNHSVTAADYAGVSPALTYTISSSITLSANTGAVGSSFTVSGTGFAASSAVSFFLDSTLLTVNASTDATGNFSNVAVTVPTTFGGNHNFKVQDASSNSVTKSFSVTATMNVGPTTGPIDTVVAITGKGFLSSIPISVTYDGATVTSLLSLASSADGSINTSFKIPASASGIHMIAVSDGTTTINANFTTTSTSSIDVTSGPVGTSVTASGNGFKNKGNITITYNNAQVGTVTADSHGSFTTTFTIPPAGTGAHSLIISDQTNTQTYNFSVTPTFNPLSPTSGFIGTNITVGGNGFGASKTITVTYDSSPVTLTTAGTTDANGTFTVSFKAPVSKNGDHSVVVSDGTTSKTFTFTIDKTPPPAPTLSLPTASTKLGKVPTLSWTPVSDSNGGITYTMQISKDISFNTIILQKTGLTTTSYTLNTQTPAEKLKSASKSAPYYWRVQATDAASNVSAWTTPQTFLVGLTLDDYLVYIIMGVIAIMLGALGFVLGRLTRRKV